MITYYILGFFALLMLYLTYQDYKSFAEGQHKDYKTVIVSTGVLGTFLGIFIGLFNFDTTDIGKSVPLLLDGLKLAFATSIMGMGISVALYVAQKGKESYNISNCSNKYT